MKSVSYLCIALLLPRAFPAQTVISGDWIAVESTSHRAEKCRCISLERTVLMATCDQLHPTELSSQPRRENGPSPDARFGK